MTTGTFAGTFQLVQLILRRDRFILVMWIVVLGILPAVIAASFRELFPTDADRQRFFITTASDGAYKAMLGPGFGPGLGALATQRVGIVFVLVSVASALTMIRHTRTEEELGRLELMRSGPVGRNASLTAAFLVVAGANILLSFIVAVGLVSQDLPLAGSLAFGLAVGMTGCLFGAIAAVTAQVAQGAGDARGLALGVLGLAYGLRLVGDAGSDQNALEWLSWMSPIGLLQRSRAFADERWWVFLPALGLLAALTATGYGLCARRDLGAGIVAPRLGPAAAPPGLGSPLALAWRLQQRTVLVWIAAFAVGGAMIGGITDAAVQAMEDNENLVQIFERLGISASFADTYIAAVMSFLAFAAACCAVQVALRLRNEEESQHGEILLATSVSRSRWASGHIAIAALASLACLAVGGVVAGTVYGLIIDDVGNELPRVLAAALAQLPAVWLMGALAVALFGVWPKAAGASWFVLGACLLVGQFGAILEFPEWLRDLSPFSHNPKLPGGAVSTAEIAWLLAISAVLVVAGLLSFTRRDLSY